MASLKRILVTGGRASGIAPVRPARREGARRRVRRQPLHQPEVPTSSTSWARLNFEFVRHDVTHPLFSGRRDLQPRACPAARAPSTTHQDDEDQRARRDQHARPRQSRRAKILQASTSEVYGDPTEHPQRETYRGNVSCIGPRPSDEGKRAARTLFFDYHRSNGVNIRVMHLQHLRPACTVRQTRRLQLHPPGSPATRSPCSATEPRRVSFCFVDDLIDGMMKLMNGPDDFIGPVNIGNPTSSRSCSSPSSWRGLREQVQVRPQKPLPADDPLQRKPDITLAL